MIDTIKTLAVTVRSCDVAMLARHIERCEQSHTTASCTKGNQS